MAMSTFSRVGLGLLVVSSQVEAQTAEGPFRGTPASIPGVIEAEQFDFGGEGVAYSDSTINNIQKAFRPNEAVDIHALDKGGYNIGYITLGEYLRFSVNVTENVDVSFFNFKVSSDKSTGSFRLVSGGTGCDDYTTDLTGVVAVPDTGGWQEYINMAVSGGSGSGLKAGPAFIWLCPLSETFNIDYFTLMTSADPKGAYGGPATVPGLIEAEEFDYGGEGVAYSDTSAVNIPGSFRDTAVDVHALDTGGYNIGYITLGEYLRYTVVVTGNFDSFNFIFVVSSAQTTGSFRIVSGGTGCADFTTDLSGIVAVPYTGGWQNYQTLTVSGPTDGGLAAGKAQIWLCPVSETFNIDSFTMEGVAASSAAYGGIPPTVPGLIEAEGFDVGGQGVAYYDKTPANTGNAYRTDESVDIEALDGGGYKVGNITRGEFLRYSVDVTADVDAFFFSFVLSSNKGTASFQIVSGGTGCDDFTTNLSGRVTVPHTGGFRRLKTVLVSGQGDGGLAAGPAVIWLCVITSSFNIDSFTMSADEVKSTPYSGTPISIPGLIEAEFFDKGGQALAYYDDSPTNKGNAFRTKEAVDIGKVDNGYIIGWIADGEYLQYTVDISKDVTAFNFSFRVAAPKKNSGSFRVVAGGKACNDYTTDLSGLVTAPTAGWSKFQDVKVVSGGTGGLPAGVSTIRLCVVGARFSIDSFVMEYK